MIIGYARIATAEQGVNHQLDKLKEYGCEKIYQDVGEKIQLDQLLADVKDGDKVVVTRLDRLTRDLNKLHDIITKFENRSIKLISLHEAEAKIQIRLLKEILQ